MNYIKMLGLTALAALGLMACAATASATAITSPSGTTYTSSIILESGHITIKGSWIDITCSGGSSISLNVEKHGAGVTAGGKVNSWTFATCGPYSIVVKKSGSWEFHTLSGGSGTMTSSGAEFLLITSVGECVLTTNGTDMGSLSAGSPATLNVASAKIPRTGGNFLCGSSATMNASYTVTTPSSLYVD